MRNELREAFINKKNMEFFITGLTPPLFGNYGKFEKYQNQFMVSKSGPVLKQ